MSEAKIDSRALIAALAEEARPAAGEHPGVESLLDYRAGRLEPEAEAGVRAHLVACRPCARRLLELEPFVDGVDAEDTVADLETEAALRRLEARIRGDRIGFVTTSRWRPAVAAAVLLMVVGSAAWVARLHGRVADLRLTVAELKEPRANFRSVVLEPTHRSSAAAVEVPGGSPLVHLVIVPESSLSEYGVALLDAAGGETWSRRGFELTEDGTVSLLMPRDALPAGEFRLRLYGFDSDRRRLEQEHLLRSPPG